MSDELRDRLRATIDRALDQWMNSTEAMGTEAESTAQAIIDDLGLTVERGVETNNRSYDRRTGIVTNGWKYRVVGRWEQQ